MKRLYVVSYLAIAPDGYGGKDIHYGAITVAASDDNSARAAAAAHIQVDPRFADIAKLPIRLGTPYFVNQSLLDEVAAQTTSYNAGEVDPC